MVDQKNYPRSSDLLKAFRSSMTDQVAVYMPGTRLKQMQMLRHAIQYRRPGGILDPVNGRIVKALLRAAFGLSV